MRNPWVWLASQFGQKAVPIACGTPHVWAAEQSQAAEWALADKAQSYDGKFYSGDDAKGGMGSDAKFRRAKNADLQ